MSRDEQVQATLAADLELLRELAEAATPGPWEASTSEATMNDRSGYRFGPRNKPLVFRADQMRAADAAYIAAVSPDAVLALLDETTELRSIVVRMPQPRGDHDREGGPSMSDLPPILCPECGHDIDYHEFNEPCWGSFYLAGYCDCEHDPSDIARALLTVEPTEAEAAQWLVDSTHQFQGDTCLCGFRSPVSRQRTEHITGALSTALQAAREARA